MLMQSHVTQGARASKDACSRLVKRIAEVLKYVAVRNLGGEMFGEGTGHWELHRSLFLVPKDKELEAAGEPECSSACVLSWGKNSSLQFKNL